MLAAAKGVSPKQRELHAQIGAVFGQIRRRLQVECNAYSGASDAVRGDQIQAVFVRRKDEINGDFAFGRFALPSCAEKHDHDCVSILSPDAGRPCGAVRAYGASTDVGWACRPY